SLVEAPLGWELISALIQSADGISARSGFAALTRGVYRLAHDENPFAGQILPDTPANIALWNVTELMVQTPDSRVASWSTDPRARIPLLPVLASDVPLPVLDRMYTRGGE
ncbi:MAG: amidohydrolase, partial [Rothia dentocariosa]